jgi:Ran GTPase-activating protein (RanGAP) involved in mRNA processing and transport
MPKKEKIPPPGNKKDEFTNFYSKSKWKQLMLKSTLDVNGRNLRPTGALIVGNALAKNRWVTQLDICHNHISDQGATDLAQILKINDTIQNINLACNEITDVGGIAIASAFIPYANPTGQPSQWNRSVYYLNLSGNLLGNDALVALANAAACHRDLTKVDVSNNQIGGLGCKAFRRSMERNSLCTFILGGNQLSDEGTRHYCEAVKTYGGKGSQAALNLNNNDISKGGAEAIGRLLEMNDFVQDINISWNTLGFKGTEALVMQMLPPNSNVVRYLNIAHNCLGDEGAAEIAKLIDASLPSLTRINVSSNQIRDAGGAALAAACLSNTTLTIFLGTNNDFGDKTVEGFAEVIRATKTLKMIDLRRNAFSNEQIAKLSDAQKNTSCEGLRAPYDQPEEPAMNRFLDKIKEAAEMQRRQEEEEASKKKSKKGKK